MASEMNHLIRQSPFSVLMDLTNRRMASVDKTQVSECSGEMRHKLLNRLLLSVSERFTSERFASDRFASERIASERFASKRFASERLPFENMPPKTQACLPHAVSSRTCSDLLQNRLQNRLFATCSNDSNRFFAMCALVQPKLFFPLIG